jgi:hypothetical protein
LSKYPFYVPVSRENNNIKSEEYKEEEKQEEWEAPQGRIGREGAGQLKS